MNAKRGGCGAGGLLENERFPYTCVVTASDGIAAEVYQYVAGKGLAVGRDISVVAFGGDGLVKLKPKLAMAKQDYTKISEAAIGLLLKLFDAAGAPVKAERVLIESGMSEGESVADIR
jgi:DNA-binding LacI/PurR family transcriptional regulator